MVWATLASNSGEDARLQRQGYLARSHRCFASAAALGKAKAQRQGRIWTLISELTATLRLRWQTVGAARRIPVIGDVSHQGKRI